MPGGRDRHPGLPWHPEKRSRFAGAKSRQSCRVCGASRGREAYGPGAGWFEAGAQGVLNGTKVPGRAASPRRPRSPGFEPLGGERASRGYPATPE